VSSWHPHLSALALSLADLEAILEDALRVLAEIGIECASPRARRLLGDWPGASASGDRIRLAAAPVRRHLEQGRTADGPVDSGAEPFTLGGCWAGLTYCDPLTQQVRPATSDEAAAMIRFWDARGVAGVVPVIPGDVPPALTTLAAERLALLHSRRLGGSLTVTDPEEVRLLIELNQAAGRRYRLMEQVGISPLRLNADALDTAIAFAGRPDVEVSLAGFIPMAGVTCPLDPRAALVQAVAEESCLSVLSALAGLDGGALAVRIEPFDFRYSSIVFGSPEWCLYRALVLQMNAYLSGRPVRHGAFRSVAKRPDAQAACERTASVLWQALLGVRHFGAVGQLSVDEVFSPQQAVLDREILDYVERVIQGIDPGGTPADAVDLIRQGVAEGSFVGVPDTTSRFRQFYHFPELFRHWNLGRWRCEGEADVLAAAWDQAQQELARSDFALPADQQRDVERVFARAARYVRQRRGS
jgi:trimethylamine---corrinoid protein Co-methyltransferase